MTGLKGPRVEPIDPAYKSDLSAGSCVGNLRFLNQPGSPATSHAWTARCVAAARCRPAGPRVSAASVDTRSLSAWTASARPAGTGVRAMPEAALIAIRGQA